MVQLKILSGKKAGTAWTARHFPVRIGRSTKMDLRLEEDGVWDSHLRLDFQRDKGIVLTTQGEALASVNSEPVREALLRGGDHIDCGSVRLQFWLSDNFQPGIGFRELLIWSGIAAITLGQVWLIYWLISAGSAGGQ
jgi:hypothetical protein